MKRAATLLSIAILTITLCHALTAEAQAVKPMLEKIGTTKGICVVLGDTKCEFALELARNSELLVYMQMPNAEATEAARKIVDGEGLYGTRIFIQEDRPRKLHLADNVADAVIAMGRAAKMSPAEALRVLRPKGKAILGDKVMTKPALEGADDWSHPYHGPDNNPQSDDKVILAPYLTQFMAEPRYAPLPQVAVASDGRVFKAYGHVAFKKREEPLLNTLVAYNGYNGTELWRRDLREGVMIHRNTLIATPDVLYVGDDKSCKLIDTATGKLIDEIVPPMDVAGGTFWKWMAMEDGVLYAMTGPAEQRDPTKRWHRELHGWPWNPISKGFNQPDQPWGYGRSILAIDPQTKEVLWDYHEDRPVDGRAICMKDGRIYAFSFGSYLTCLNAKDGSVIWRKTPENARKLFDALGEYSPRQDWRTNWRTTCYLKCSDEALYFAGPQVDKLLAVSAQTGDVLWEDPYNNYQLVLRGDVMYGMSGQIDKHPSTKFNAMTGEVLAQINKARRACSRTSGSADAIFCRAEGGSLRWDIASNRPHWISPMRAQCHDGVTIANGLLYWWPSVCDCQLTLYGITTLGPAGDFDFNPDASPARRLEADGDKAPKALLAESAADWPTFRADNQCSATSSATIAREVDLLWASQAKAVSPSFTAVTGPVVVDGMAFIGGGDGAVTAIDVATGKVRWRTYTGGIIRIAPTIWKSRAYVGSGDGYVYCLEARTGRQLWRFRAAPKERLMPVYGSLMSTWPVAAGVLVEDGTAYVAAGLANYDGTYVYALDAATGKLKWQNNNSGHLDADARTGVSVQGHMLLHNNKLYLAGGTSISPVRYDAQTGKCLNDAGPLADCVSRSPRGWELSLLGDQVGVCGKPFYAHPQYRVYDQTAFDKVFISPAGKRNVVWTRTEKSGKILCFEQFNKEHLKKYMSNLGSTFHLNYGKFGMKDKPAWTYDCPQSVAWAVCRNAVIVACESQVVALEINSGAKLWSKSLPAAPVTWGLAVDRDGKVIVTLVDGRVVCIGANGKV